MEVYQELKRKKAADKKLKGLQEVKVVVIQAWWRGFIVRNHLGSFKKFKKRAREIKKEFKTLKSKEKGKKRQ